MKTLNYEKQPDGTWKETIVDVPEGGELYEQAMALADKFPGRIVVGCENVKDDQLQARIVKLLED